MTAQTYTSRNAIDPVRAKGMDTTELRENFLVEDMFVPGKINLTYTHYDRMVVGGATPAGSALALEAVKSMGTKSFLDRRELAIFNVGATGTVSIGSESHTLEHRDMIYIGMGAGEVSFTSADAADPAKFYIISAPAHTTYPTTMVPDRRCQAHRSRPVRKPATNARSSSSFILKASRPASSWSA